MDIVDGTPLLDIKPLVSQFDAREADHTGWLAENLGKLSGLRDDGEFAG